MFKRMKRKQEQRSARGSSADETGETADDDRGNESAISVSDTTVSSRPGSRGVHSGNEHVGAVSKPLSSSQKKGADADDSDDEVQFVKQSKAPSGATRTLIGGHDDEDDEVQELRPAKSVEQRQRKSSQTATTEDDDDDIDEQHEFEAKTQPDEHEPVFPMKKNPQSREIGKYDQWKPVVHMVERDAPKFSFSLSKHTTIHGRKMERWNTDYNGFGDLMEPFIAMRLGIEGKLQYTCLACTDHTGGAWSNFKRTRNLMEHLKDRCSRKNVSPDEMMEFQEAVDKAFDHFQRNVQTRYGGLHAPVEQISQARAIIDTLAEQRRAAVEDSVALFFKRIGIKRPTESQLLQVKAFLKDIIGLANSSGLTSADAAVLKGSDMREEFAGILSRLTEESSGKQRRGSHK